MLEVTFSPDGENSGVVGLSVELVPLDGESGPFEPVGLNTGAEGLSLGEMSGVMGLKEVSCVCCVSGSILLWFPSIGAVSVTAAGAGLSCSTASSNWPETHIGRHKDVCSTYTHNAALASDTATYPLRSTRQTVDDVHSRKVSPVTHRFLCLRPLAPLAELRSLGWEAWQAHRAPQNASPFQPTLSPSLERVPYST